MVGAVAALAAAAEGLVVLAVAAALAVAALAAVGNRWERGYPGRNGPRQWKERSWAWSTEL